MDVENLPIDIHCTKLLSWLVSRHHCGRKWQERLDPVRQKINAAIQDMPENEEIKGIISGSYIDYFQCLKIMEILKNTECGAKNFFGQYSSQKMRDWQEIIRLYTTDGVYLGEASQILIRNVTFEVPAVKKQMEKWRKTQADCSRKEREFLTAASEWQNKFQLACQRLGIEGQQVKRELLHLANDLPHYLERFAADASRLETAVAMYEAATRHIINDLPDTEAFCSLLRYLISKGNTTLFEHRHGRIPDRVEAPSLDLLLTEDAARESDPEIDWGELEDEIDFGITVEDDDKSEEATPDLEEGNVARGDEALRLLDHAPTRELLVTELSELSAFLLRFEEERGSQAGLLTEAVWEGAPNVVSRADEAMVAEQRRLVDDALEKLTNSRTKHLLLIRSSPRYVDRVADQVTDHKRREERTRQSARLMELKRQEAAEEEQSLEPRLQKLRDDSMKIKIAVEKEISAKYNGRRVNIMGEVNSM